MSLIDQTTATMLVTKGARLVPLAGNLKVRGIGDGYMMAKEELVCTVKFADGKARTLVAVVVPFVPYGMIIGINFMRQQNIGFVATEEGIRLFDNNKWNRPVIYDTEDNKNPEDPSEPATNTVHANSATIKKKLGKKGTRKYVERWNKMSSEDRNLISTLARVKLVNLTETQLKEKLLKSSLRLEDKEVTVNLAEHIETNKTNAPLCDFPDYQDQLNSLIGRFPEVFSASRSDVGKSTGNRVTIKLASDESVNVRNYRTPMKLRPILSSLIKELLDAGVIETCESNEFNSPVLLVPKKSDGTKGSKSHRMVIIGL